MLKRGSDIIGLPVICLEDNSKKGKVKDILFDQQTMNLKALLVDEGGLMHSCRFIHYHNISSFDDNVITVQKSSFVEHVPIHYKASFQFHGRQDILDLEVLTEEGQNIGMVQDLLFDIDRGKITALILTDGLFHDLIEGRPLLPLVDSVSFKDFSVIVPQEMKNEVQYHTGGLKKILSLE
ncbi:Uncharacterized protein YrrD, contains PRC-barrel domain [Geosporobacter subterraneus DSM 17957]|uniref:Uncharacterized protein YrrD, contains PRC-barrel domain n=1 Tax=Geosporobacter subterraneus DSM 17957 TaxID=1121919 RepID=A0A1M6BW00_9FIRM|nr:PRC-barrel domain-containing protein [Geosporobacter subterraneus]SHI52827.1 Uncharacterized protein YrrD, contains PRC-barrel domain [Geosporobacter subterraneus DSM 17957]